MKICCPNQLIGFYTRATLALNGLNKKSDFLYLTLPCLIVWGGRGGGGGRRVCDSMGGVGFSSSF